MTNTPNIEVASSDKNLNQRFKKPKSNLLVFVLVGILAVAIVATPILMSGGNKDEDDNKQQAKDVDQKEKKVVAPKLAKSSFEAKLAAGELATFDLRKSLKDANVSDCSVEWNESKSNLPKEVFKNVKVTDQLLVSIPTESLGVRSPKQSVDPFSEWILVGRVVAGENATKDFSLNLIVKWPNTPPTVTVKSVTEYDPVFGVDIKFSVADKETTSRELSSKVISVKHQSNLDIGGALGNKTIEFRPKVPTFDSFDVILEVEDPDGLVSSCSLKLTPKPSSRIANLIAVVDKEDIDLSKSNIGRLGSSVSMNVMIYGEPLKFLESIDGSPLPEILAKAKPQQGESQFKKENFIVSCYSRNPKLLDLLRSQYGQAATGKPAAIVKRVSANDRLLETTKVLLDEKKLFNSKGFGPLVEAFVEDFERENASLLDQKYQELDGLKEFLDENKGLKAELFLALNPIYDKPDTALVILNEIRKQHPKEIVPYKNLAIAIAVCWDTPRANYSFVGHQRRTKAILPENLTSAVDNFKHFVTYQNQMQGRAQWLPWEFLVHVINHQTPDRDKYWALDNYLPQRVQFGKCYKDVPYDYEMLNTSSRVCKLGGKEYSLPNIRTHGGVCAMQADFAARVGKSLGVPSEYVGGKSANGENHAWVMWVEIKNVTRTGIAFSLESYGRYRGDHYHVGNLKDPKSGQRITDRQLELRLHTVGSGAYAKRQVDLLMRVFPDLVKSCDMDLKEQLKYLEQVIKICPWHEDAWTAVANLIANNEIDRKMHRQMNQILNSMFVHFAAFPDFTWEIFDRLVSYVPTDAERNKYYVKLLNLYVAAKRPDLACDAQLKLTDYLEKQKKVDVAIQGLAVTVKTFPDEGRYVPLLLDRLEKLVGDDPDLINQLVQFHVEFLPLVPQKRGNRASKYCIKMYQRAIQFFIKHGANDYANLYKTKLQQIQALSN